MKALKIFTSNSKHFRISSTFNKWQINVSRLTLNTTFSLITSVSNNLWSWKFTAGCFLTQEIEKWHRNCPKTSWFWGIRNPIKIYRSVYICKRKRCGTIAEYFSFFRSHCFKYHKLDVVKKWSLSSVFRFKRSNEGLEAKNMSITVS